jgi:AraC family transcriptional regulator
VHNAEMTATYSPITLGAQIHTVALRGYILTETEHAGGSFLPRHAHQNANIALIRQGSFLETVGRSEWTCKAGNAIFKPAGADHSNRYGRAGMKCLLIELPPAALGDDDVAVGLAETTVMQDGRLAHLGEALHQEMNATDASAALAAEGLVLQILATMLRMKSPRETQAPRWLSQFRAALHDRSSDTFRIGDLARELGVHPTHAVREFRRRYGTTPGDYVRRIRIDRACDLLRRGSTPASAAAAAGFSHQSHFTRLLKRYLSVTPRQYVDRLR